MSSNIPKAVVPIKYIEEESVFAPTTLLVKAGKKIGFDLTRRGTSGHHRFNLPSIS
jgi:hypothetical protein